MMTLLLLARLVLASVFAVAGLAKLADRAGARRALREFGAPAPLAGPLAVALPVAEVGVAGFLLPASTATGAAWAALGLLLAFSTAIAWALARGRTPDCHCFGQLHSRPAGAGTLARNLGLVVVAGGVALAGGTGSAGPSVGAWLAGSPLATPSGALLAVASALIAGMGWGLLGLLRQNGRLLLRIEAIEAQVGVVAPIPAGERGLPVGAPAPAFRLPALDGEEVGLDDVLSTGRPALLVFSDPECGPCRDLLPETARWQREHAELWTIVVVSRGDAGANAEEARRHGLRHVLRQDDREVAAAYGCHGTPGAVLIDARGRVASPLLEGTEAVRAWVARATTAPAAPPPTPARRPVGAPAPEVRLPMVDGPAFDLADLRGTETVLVFWNPRCGYCQRMLPDLRAAEADLAADPRAPRLVVVSSGTTDVNRAQGLQSPVLLDEAFATGRALDVTGTPSAVRIDAAGRVASDVVVGAPAVLALATGSPVRPVPAR